jgi:uncharacterized membrane protein YkoI
MPLDAVFHELFSRAAHDATMHRMIRWTSLLMLTAMVPAVADDDRDHELARAAVERGEILALDEILRRLPRRAGERLLEVEVERDDGRWIYEIEWVGTDGRVREIEVDARDGRVLDEDD